LNSTGLAVNGLGFNPLAHFLKLSPSLFDPRSLHAQRMSLNFYLSTSGHSKYESFAIGFLIFSICGLISCVLCSDADKEEMVVEQDYATMKVTQGFLSPEFSHGSWAQAYREARGEDKEALELLFRCNIISTEEFAFSSVSHEHIQECIWIAKHMLRQKPLEEWVALWQQAQLTFQDSVTACFEARGTPRARLSSNLETSAPMIVPALESSRGSHGGMSLDLSNITRSDGRGNDLDDPYTTRSIPEQHTPAWVMRPHSVNTIDSDTSRWTSDSEFDDVSSAQRTPDPAQRTPRSGRSLR